jgi:hypothetical protein
MQPTAGIAANPLSAALSEPRASAKGTAARNEILWSRRGLDMDGMSNAKKENFLLKFCNQIARCPVAGPG